jgi:L-threonylcarbamoyladenylate synthase
VTEDVVAALRAGRAVILPTDTVYGLCVLPEHEDVLYELKGRDRSKPVALLAADVDAIAAAVPGLDRVVLSRLLPGPYTLVVPAPGRAPVGVRVPDLPPAAAEVLRAVGVVAATSANASGGPGPPRVEDVPQEIRAACGAIVDAGELPGTPSTVLDLSGPEPRVLREGAVPADEALARAVSALS